MKSKESNLTSYFTVNLYSEKRHSQALSTLEMFLFTLIHSHLTIHLLISIVTLSGSGLHLVYLKSARPLKVKSEQFLTKLISGEKQMLAFKLKRQLILRVSLSISVNLTIKN